MNSFEEQSDIECEFEPLVSALMDDELSNEVRLDVTSHLATCKSCLALLERFRAVDSLVVMSYDDRTCQPKVIADRLGTISDSTPLFDLAVRFPRCCHHALDLRWNDPCSRSTGKG